MGDQLAKGWADSKALPVRRGLDGRYYALKAQERHAKNMAEFNKDWRLMFDAQQRRLVREYLAEEAAEEAMLP